jgi:TolB-like protein/DNA-binding winged helix-turn-helix (wHTH) protein/Flp pilus assembly protein TadD
LGLAAEIIQFDEFELDLGRYELRRGQKTVKLEKNPMELLILLVEHHARLVTRDEIIQRLWGQDVFVDTRHGINTAVHKLRAALRDDPEHPRILETVVGKGYRLVSPVTGKLHPDDTSPRPLTVKPELDRPAAGSPPPQGRSVVVAIPEKRRVSIRAFLIGAVIATCIAVAVWIVPRAVRGRSRKGSADLIQSLAVLPFQNLSGDPSKEYFADAFTDELTTALAERTRVRVVSRTSVIHYKASAKTLPEIARELRVDAVVEGSVVLEDQQLRITVQLIQASNDRHLWAQTYSRTRKDLLPTQNEVAAAIADRISVRTGVSVAGSTFSAPTRNRFTPETYELFMECKSLDSNDDEAAVIRKIQCFQRILTVDPKCAPVYAAIADDYLKLGLTENLTKASAAAVKAVELDPSLAEAHLALAEVRMSYGKDFAMAERELRQALSLNPSLGAAHSFYSELLVATGRTAEAVEEGKRLKDLDPLSGGVRFGLILFMAHQYDQAIAEERSAQEFYPRSERPPFLIGYAYEQKGLYKNAIAEYQKELARDEHGIFLAAMGRAMALSGNLAEAAEIRRKIEHFPPNDFVWPYDAALFYAAIGDRDRAFQWLDKCVDQHDDWLLFLNEDPRLSGLRADPRFNDVVRREGLPQAQNP